MEVPKNNDKQKALNALFNAIDRTVQEDSRKRVGGHKTVKDLEKTLGIRANSTSTYNDQMSEIKRLVGADTFVDTGVDYTQNLAANQSDSEAFTRGAQMLGKGVVSGFLQNIASWDFGSIRDMATGDTSKEFGNALTESSLAKWAKDTTGLEIYQNGDDFGSSKYWARFIGQQGFTLGIMAEMALEQGILAMTTGGAGNIAGAASKSRLLYNLLTGVNGLYGGVREAWMNGLETQENTYNKYIQLGFDKETAKKRASEAAAIGFRAEVGPTMLLNGIQSLATFGKFASKGVNKALEESMDFGISSAVGKFGSIFEKSNNKFIKNAGMLLTDSISEGVEEGYQTWVGNYAKDELQKRHLGFGTEESFWNEEMRDSILMGALSGGMMAGFGKAVRSFSDWYSGKSKRLGEATESFMSDVTKNSVTSLKDLNEATKKYQEAFEKFNAEKTKENAEEVRKAKKKLIIAQEKQGTAQVLQAMELDHLKGNENNEIFNAHLEQIDNAIKALQTNDTQKLTELGLLDEEGNSVSGLTIPEMLKSLQSDKEKALKTKKRVEDHLMYTTQDFGTVKQLVDLQTQADIYEDIQKENNGKIASFREGNQLFAQLSNEGKEIYELSLRKAAIENVKDRNGMTKKLEEELREINKRLEEIAKSKGKEGTNDLYSSQDMNIIRRDFIGMQAQQENYIDHYETESIIDKLYDSIEENSRLDKIKENIKARRAQQIASAKLLKDLNRAEREREKAEKKAQKDAAKAKTAQEKEEAKKELKELEKEKKEIEERKEKAEKVEATEQETGNKVSEKEREELISKGLFEETPQEVVSESSKEPTETTESVADEAAQIAELIKSGKISLSPSFVESEEAFDESEPISSNNNTFEEDVEPVVSSLNEIDFDANARLSGNFEDKKEFAKDQIAKIFEELGLDYPDFEEYIKYFIERKGRKFVDDNFPGFVALWELAGYDNSKINEVYNKYFNTVESVSSAVLELMQNGTLTEQFNNEAEKTVVKKDAPAITTRGTVVIRDNMVEDNTTENPNPKAAHLGVRFEQVNTPKGYVKRYSESVLNEDPSIGNHYVLDKEFMKEGREFDVKVSEDSIVTVWSTDENGNKVKKAVPFKELGLKKGSPEYNAKVPLIAYYNGVPVFHLHDYEWYNKTNISNRGGLQTEIIKEGVRAIQHVRDQILNQGKTKIRITQNNFGKILNLSEMAKEEDTKPITLNEASKGSKLVVATSVNTIADSIGDLSTADLVNDFSKNPLIIGATYEIREIGDGRKILLSVSSNRVNQPDSMSEVGYNTVKFGLLASYYLNNRNNLNVVIEQDSSGNPVTLKDKLASFGMTEDKAIKIHEAIKKSYKIDIITDAHRLFDVFTTVSNNDDDFIKNANNTNNNQKVTLFPQKSANGIMSIQYHVKGVSKDVSKKAGGYTTANSISLNNPKNLKGFFLGFNILFEGNRGNFSYNNFRPNKNQLNSGRKIFGISNSGEIIPYSSTNGESTYDDLAKDNLRTNVKSFEIDTIDGKKKNILDIQPMIYYEVVDSSIAPSEAQENPNITPITPTNNDTQSQSTIGSIVSQVKEESNQSELDKRKAESLKALRDLKSKIGQEINGILFTEEMYTQAEALVKQEFDESFDSAASITVSQYQLIEATKNNRISGISILEENELLNTLFYSTLEGVDLNKHEVSLSSIRESLINSLKTVEKTLEETEAMATINPILAPVFKQKADKLRAILLQKEKLIGKNGSLITMLNRFFGEEIEFNEEEKLEDSDESILSIQDGDGTEKNYSESSLEKNVKITFSSSLKILLARVKSLKKDGTLKLNSLQLPMYEDIDNVAMTLQEVMVKGNTDFNTVVNILKERGESTRPNAMIYAELYKLFYNAPKQIQNEILYKMTSDVLNMYMILMQEGSYSSNSVKLALQNANSMASDIRLVREWKNNFFNSDLFMVKDGEKVYNIEKVMLLNQEINEQRNLKEDLSPDNQEHVKRIYDLFSKFGIILSENTIKEIIRKEGNNIYEKNKSLSHLQGVLNNILKEYQERNKGDKKGEVKAEENEFNIFDREATNIRENFANLEIDLNGSIIEKSYRVAGKSIQGTVQKMMAFDAISDLKDPDNDKAELLSKIPYSSRNYMLQFLLDEKSNMRNFLDISFVSLESIKERGKKVFGSKKITDIPEVDNVLSQLGFFQNTVKKLTDKVKEYPNLSFRLAKMFNPTLSDKNQMLLYNMAMIDVSSANLDRTFANASNSFRVGEEIVEFLTDQLFESELERILSSFKEKTNTKKYDKASEFFLAFPGFNTLKIDVNGTKMSLIEYLHLNKKLEKGLDNIQSKRNDIREAAKQYISKLIENEVRSKINFETKTGEWLENNFVSIDEKGDFQNNFLDTYYLSSKGITNNNFKEATEIAAFDFVINNLLAQNNTYQLIAGDVALYSENPSKFASKDSKGDINSIDFIALSKKTAENIDKRMAMLIAPGNKLANSLHEKYLQIMVNDPVTITSTSRQLIKQYYGELSSENESAISFIESYENEAEQAVGTKLDILKKSYENEVVKVKDKNGNTKYVSVDKDGNIQYFSSLEEAKINGNILKGVEGHQEFLKLNNPEIGDYFDIEGTDAQELTTWQEHLDILLRQGRLTETEERQIKEAYNKLSKGEVLDSELLKVVMQPIKPVYAGGTVVRGENNEPIMNRVTYIKSSSYPLLPQLTAGLKIDKIRQHMEKLQDFHKGNRKVRLSFQTANKVGSVDSTLSVHDLYNKSFEELFHNGNLLRDNVLELERKHFKIQQDTPYKTAKNIAKGKDDSLIMGSQMWKIILGNGINKIDRPIFPNHFDQQIINEYNSTVELDVDKIKPENGMITGKDLDKIKTYVEDRYITNEKKKLYKQLGLDENTNKPKDEKLFIGELQKLLISEAKSRNYTDGLIDGLEIFEDLEKIDFNIPLWLSSGSNKFEALLQAIISNRLIVLKLPGNSHYTASSEGFRFNQSEIGTLESISENKKSDIVWLDPNHSGELKATTNENGTLNEAEVLIQSKFRITKEDGTTELIDLTKSPYSEEDKATGKKVLNKEMIDQALLSMFSFRIPTSSHQSGAILKVVGFLPEASGDLIVVPKEHTKQIGEDYDIDKRNVYKSNYIVKENGRIEKLTSENSSYFTNNNLREQIKNLKDRIKELSLINKGYYERVQELDEIDESNENILFLLLKGDLESYSSEEQKQLIRMMKLNKEEKAVLLDNLETLRKEFVSYREEKETEKKLLENAMIDVYKSVYQTTDNEIQKKINKILSFEVAGSTAKEIDKRLNSKEDTKYFNIYSDAYQRKLMRLGSAGKLGISVHSNTVTLLSQIQRLDEPVVVKKALADSEGNIELEKSVITIDGLESDGTLGGTRRNGYRTLDGMRLISDVVGENQNSATDNVKAQIMGKRNENAYTINVLTMLTLRGYDMTSSPVKLDNGKEKHLQINSLFLSQPILRRYVELQEKYKSITSDFVPDKENEIIKQLIEEFDIINREDRLVDFAVNGDFMPESEYLKGQKELTGQNLYDGLIDDKNTQNTLMQLTVLKMFLNLKEEAENIGEYQRLINLNSSKLGISYFNTLDRITSLRNLAKETKLSGVSKLVGDFIVIDEDTSKSDIENALKDGYFLFVDTLVKPTTPEGVMLVNSLKSSEAVFDELYPYKTETISKIIEEIIEKSGKKNLKGAALNDLRYTIMQEFKEFLYSSKDSGLFENSVRDERERLFMDIAGNESLASFINRLQKNPSNFLKNNEFVKSLQTELSLTGGVSVIKNSFEEMDKFSQSNRYNDFLKMLQDNKTIIGEWNGYKVTPFQLAQELATYAYFANQEGGATGFRNNINANYLNVIGFSKYLRDMNKSIFSDTVDSFMVNTFVTQFFQHNPDLATNLGKDRLKSIILGEDKDIIFNYNSEALESFNTWKNTKSKKDYNNFVSKLNRFIVDSSVQTREPEKALFGEFIALKFDRVNGKGYKLFQALDDNRTYVEIAVLGDDNYNEYDKDTFKADSSINPVREYVPSVDPVVVKPLDISKDEETTVGELLSSVFEEDTNLKGLLNDLLPYVDKNIKVIFSDNYNGKNVSIATYMSQENVIVINPMMKLESFVKRQQKLANSENYLQEVVLEEIIHSITVSELAKWGVREQVGNNPKEFNYIVREDAPVFIKKLNDLYTLAKEKIKYDPTNHATYPMMNIAEFVAGVFSNGNFRELLDSTREGNKTLLDRFRELFKNLVTYLTGKKYSDEVMDTVMELLKAKGRTTEFVTTDTSTKEFKESESVDKVKTLLRNLKVEDVNFTDEISPYSTQQLSMFQYRKMFSDNIINDLKAGKAILVSPRENRNEVELKYINDIINYLKENIPGVTNVNNVIEYKRVRNNLYMLKIKDTFAENIAKADSIDTGNFDYSGFNLQQAINHIMKNNPSITTEELKNKLKEIGLIKQDC